MMIISIPIIRVSPLIAVLNGVRSFVEKLFNSSPLPAIELIENNENRGDEKWQRPNFTSLSKYDYEKIFSDIIQDYGSIISGVCFSYSTTSEDVEDLRQDIMINIWKGLRSFHGHSSLSTWIYRVALNTCVSTLRKRKRRIETTLLSGNQDISDTPSETEQIEWLHHQISRLNALDKAVITMWLDERKYEEIAEVTGVSRNNVAVRINRIKEKLSKNKGL